jgi:F-box/leucine-rich repeat protein 2/20
LVTDVGIRAIAKHSNAIEKLILYGCEKLTNVGIRDMSLACSKMTYLDLSSCYNVDDVSLTIIAGGAWKLQYLYLRDCDRISDNGVSRIAQGLGKHLKILDLKGCSNVGEFGDRALRAVGANCVELEELIMCDARRVEDSAFIAIAQGCVNLRILAISGCEEITKKGMRSLLKTSCSLQRLKIDGCRKVGDSEFEFFHESPLQATLTSLELNHFSQLTDRGIGAICKTLGSTLLNLDVSNCPLITDLSATMIGNLCTRLRAIDFSHCGQMTDKCINSLARNLSCLTSLKLDGNPHISSRALIAHAGVELEFVEMAMQWLGYQPKNNVETLIQKKEVHVYQTKQALLIQSALRRKFANRIYWERYRSRLLSVVIPLFQAHVRGMIQRKKHRLVMAAINRNRMAVKIQAKWRKYYALHERIRVMKNKRYVAFRNEQALFIQRLYRAHVHKMRTEAKRIDRANKLLEETKEQALRETRAIVIQRIFRGDVGRRRTAELDEQRRLLRELNALKDRCARFIQRVIWGKSGRIKARRRRWEIAHAQLMWESARHVQRAYRGHLGRLRFKRILDAHIHRVRMEAATNIQRLYRGYRGRLLAAVARALRILRAKQQYFAVEIQRTMRGCVGRHHFKVHKELETRRRRKIKACALIQRIFRGHKGREARVIEYELQRLDSQARPLILQLKHLEEEARKLGKLIHQMEDVEARMSDNLFHIEREYEQCKHTTSKNTDSSRVNGTPQRFLTKFLVIRLKDLLEHETVRLFLFSLCNPSFYSPT